MPRVSESRVQTFALMTVAAVCITMALIYTKSILIPFVFSFFFYSASLPGIRFFHEKGKVPWAVAILFAFVVFLAVLTFFSYAIFYSVDEFAQGIPNYRNRLLELLTEGQKFAEKLGYSLDVSVIRSELSEWVSFSHIRQFTGSAFSVLGNVFLVSIFYLFLVLGGKPKKEKSFLSEIQFKISNYVNQKFILSLATGLLSGIIFTVFGVELALMFAILTVLFNFIPNVGSLIAMALPIPVLFLQFGIGWEFFAVLILCSLTQMLIGNVIEPKWMGDSMDLHPITVLIGLMFWGLVWGIPGMFLAVPITAIIKIILARLEPTRGIAELLAGRIRD